MKLRVWLSRCINPNWYVWAQFCTACILNIVVEFLIGWWLLQQTVFRIERRYFESPVPMITYRMQRYKEIRKSLFNFSKKIICPYHFDLRYFSKLPRITFQCFDFHFPIFSRASFEDWLFLSQNDRYGPKTTF